MYILGTLKTNFHGRKKLFVWPGLVWFFFGLLDTKLVRNASFSFGGTLPNMPKLPLSPKMFGKKRLFQTAISLKPSDRDT